MAGVVGYYTDSIHNTGNAELTFRLEGEDPEGFCEFSFDPHPATVPPNEELDVAITVKPGKRGLLGRPKTYRLTLTATPEQTPEVVTMSAQLDAIAILRGWYIPLAILCLLGLAVLAYTGFWAVFQKDDLTYLQKETWDEAPRPFQARHGVIYPFEFDLALRDQSRASTPTPAKAGEPEVSPPVPVKIRGDVTWQPDENQKAPPSVAFWGWRSWPTPAFGRRFKNPM